MKIRSTPRAMRRWGLTVLCWRLEPVAGPSTQGLPWQADLVRRGLVRSARASLNAKAFGAMPLPAARGGSDVLVTLLAEREEGR